MQNLGLIGFAVLLMVGLNLLMIALTVGVKVLRSVKERWRKATVDKLECALESFMTSGEIPPELQRLWPWEWNLLATLLIENIALLRGVDRDRLVRLAADVGLTKRCSDRLNSRRRWTRARAAESLGYLGGPDVVGPLAKLLAEDLDETVQAVAARALARIGTLEASQALAQTLDDPSELTRLRVAENLERVGFLAVEPLAELLSGRKKRAPILAAQVLGNLRAYPARPALREAVGQLWDDDLRAQSALALGKIGDPEDVPVLLAKAEDEEWSVRVQVANALGMIGEISAVPTLKKLAADREWWVRLNACKALANMGPAGEQALVELLQEPDPFARDRAAAILETRGITRRMVNRLAMESPRGERARTVIRALIRAGKTKYLRYLAASLQEGAESRTLKDMLKQADDS